MRIQLNSYFKNTWFCSIILVSIYFIIISQVRVNQWVSGCSLTTNEHFYSYFEPTIYHNRGEHTYKVKTELHVWLSVYQYRIPCFSLFVVHTIRKKNLLFYRLNYKGMLDVIIQFSQSISRYYAFLYLITSRFWIFMYRILITLFKLNRHRYYL